MPRIVESHQLHQRLSSPARRRLHLCGTSLVVATATTDGQWRHEHLSHLDAAAAVRERDRHLTALSRTGYHVVTAQRHTVPAVVAGRAGREPGVFDASFEAAWALAWTAALEALSRARVADSGRCRHLVLLANYPRYIAQMPWGPALQAALADAPQALHQPTGLLVVGVGAATREWVDTYYASVLEKTPSTLPGDDADTSLTYTFALRLWQPELEGPLAQLAAALVTARDLAAAGVPL